jgi:hypothetical protein
MAKKRRKPRPRPASTTAPPPPQPAKAAPRPLRKPIDEERPPAPWGSFPLVEVVVLVALIMLVAAFAVPGPRSTVLLGTGLALGSLAGLELSIREHFAGYRSHTLLLAGAAAVATLAFLFYVVPDLLPPAARLAVAGVVAALAAFCLARAFQSRSGRLMKIR